MFLILARMHFIVLYKFFTFRMEKLFIVVLACFSLINSEIDHHLTRISVMYTSSFVRVPLIFLLNFFVVALLFSYKFIGTSCHTFIYMPGFENISQTNIVLFFPFK